MSVSYIELECLKENAKTYNEQLIFEELFDKKVEKRYLSTYINKFLTLNNDMLRFLGVEVLISGAEHNISISFKTSSTIGVVPLKMPYDGIVHKDLKVSPKFDGDISTYVELVQLLSLLDYSIKPKYAEGVKLYTLNNLKPPAYYEAIKYIELFGVALGVKWNKFRVINKDYTYPKAGTNWSKYALTSADPQRALRYPTRDNILSTNHLGWQNLKYVFDIAQRIIMEQSVPASLKYKYQGKIRCIAKVVNNINGLQTKKISINVNDPVCIRRCKEQANILLNNDNTVSLAWRMDMAELFERFVQHLMLTSITGLSGRIKQNHKISGDGNIPNWGLRYLEPDMMVVFDNMVLMADAKYKSNMYAFNEKSDILKETHRSDLHQILAYCSFEPQNKKIGLLFYPFNKYKHEHIRYFEHIGGIENKVILCGIPFTSKSDKIEQCVTAIKKMIQTELSV